MFKKMLFAVVPMLMVASSVMADDDLLTAIASLDADKVAVAAVDDADKLGQADVDALLGDDDADGEEAVAACFRRFGHGCGYGSYSYRSYYNCYSPCYSYGYSCYTPVTYSYYTPVTYSCYTPCYTSYWGCF